jgi:hypothetical protein
MKNCAIKEWLSTDKADGNRCPVRSLDESINRTERNGLRHETGCATETPFIRIAIGTRKIAPLRDVERDGCWFPDVIRIEVRCWEMPDRLKEPPQRSRGRIQAIEQFLAHLKEPRTVDDEDKRSKAMDQMDWRWRPQGRCGC